jgi:predicted nucleotidyltransferase
MNDLQVRIPYQKIKKFCQRWQISDLRLFGSVLRDDFHPESDIDVLVSFSPDAHWTLFGLVTMQEELSEIFGRKVDLVEREAIVQSPNYIRRRSILRNTKEIYAPG